MNQLRMRMCVVACLMGLPGLWAAREARADEWKPISPEELKMTSVAEAPGAPAVYLYRQVDRNDAGIQRGRGASEYDYSRIKILTEEGRKYATIEIPFVKERTNISGIHARTINPDGTVINFDGKIYDQVVEKTKGVKFLAKTFTMPNVQVGSIIEYHYSIDLEDYFIFRSYWILSEELFTKRAEFTLKPYNHYPWNVQWSWPAGLPKGTEPPKEGPDHVIRMSTENVPAFVEEDHMPPPNELKYRVVFIYRDEPFDNDVDKYWQQFGKKATGKIEGFVDKKRALDEAVAGIVAANDTPDVKLRKIYDRVQQIKNSSYLPAKSEEQRRRENIKENKDVEELWKHQYGSGWDLTWLFLGLVRSAGFEAYPCLVSGRSEYFFRKERVNGAELDANVVQVKVNGQDRYFDPGAAYTPFGLLPWVETGVIGLRLDKNGGTWIQTTLPTSEDAQVQRSAQLKLSNDGDLTGTVKVTYTGLEAQDRRIRQRNEDDTERKKNLEDEVKNLIPSGSEVELTNSPDWKNGNAPLVAEFTLRVPGWTSAAGRRAMLPTGLFSASERHMFEHANRVWPIYFRYAFRTADDISVALPEGWKVESAPKDLDRDAKAVQYKLQIENGDRNVRILRQLRSDVVMVDKQDYPTLRSFYQLVKTGDEQQIVLQPGGGTSAAN